MGDLYSRANSEIYNLVQHWLQQDALLAQDFQNSLTPDSQLTKNLQILYGGGATMTKNVEQYSLNLVENEKAP